MVDVCQSVGGENMNTHRQMGFGWIEIIIVVAVVTFVGLVVHTYNSTIKENAELKQAVAVKEQAYTEQAAENFQLRQRAQHLQQVLTSRRERQNTMDELERRLNAKLGDVRRDDPKAREWADQSVPDSIVRGLRDDTGDGGAQDGKGTPTRKPDVKR